MVCTVAGLGSQASVNGFVAGQCWQCSLPHALKDPLWRTLQGEIGVHQDCWLGFHGADIDKCGDWATANLELLYLSRIFSVLGMTLASITSDWMHTCCLGFVQALLATALASWRYIRAPRGCCWCHEQSHLPGCSGHEVGQAFRAADARNVPQ